MHKTTGVRDPAAAFPLPGMCDDARDRGEANRAVAVSAAEGVEKGIARGIDLDGALLVETPRGLVHFVSGDVSVRTES